MNRAYKIGRSIYYLMLGWGMALAGIASGPIFESNLPEARASYEVVKSVEVRKPASIPRELKKPLNLKDTHKKSSGKSKNTKLVSVQNELENAPSWNSLTTFPSQVYKDFVQQLAQEEFADSQPFVLSQQRNLWQKILGEGLKDYTRKVYRSPHFNQGSGYDLISYEILSGQGQRIFILAYREKTSVLNEKSSSGDERVTRIDVYIESLNKSQDNYGTQVSYTAAGEILFESIHSLNSFHASRQSIVSQSTPLLTAGR